MKKLFLPLIILSLLVASVHCQVPKRIKYQTVVRNSSGKVIANQQVGIKISILQGSPEGNEVFTESYNPTTNEIGLINLEIGSANPGDFSGINWAAGPFYTKVEAMGNIVGVSELLSVPYAFYAENSFNAVWDKTGTSIYYNDGNVGIGTSTPSVALEVIGRTKTQVLEITGGADLAEPFEMSNAESLPAGTVVVIDSQNPGKLMQSIKEYDKRVAGVISGACNIRTGLTLTQEGKFNNGQHVALSGRVYVLATSSNGSIEPGDLLTTSNVLGHAMKATDNDRSFGTVIGKAMSSLESGDGFVMVLINLQ